MTLIDALMGGASALAFFPILGGLGVPQNQSYQIPRSVRLRASNSAAFSRTFTANSANGQKFVVAGWCKRGSMPGTQMQLFRVDAAGLDFHTLLFDASDRLQYTYRDNATTTQCNIITNSLRRDPLAAFHFVLAVDTTQAIAADRVRIFINKVKETSFNTASYYTLNYNMRGLGGSGDIFRIGRNNADAYLDATISDWYLLDGATTVDGSEFITIDPTTGAPVPIAPVGLTYGTTGAHLDFADNSGATATTIGKDTSGLGNNFTPSGVSVTAGVTNDSLVDTPTNYGIDTGLGGEVRGNYCTLNPLETKSITKPADGNLRHSPAGSSPELVISSIPIPSTGTWFAECVKGDSNVNWPVGLQGPGRNDTYLGQNDGIAYWANGVIISGGSTLQSGLATLTTNDTVGMLVDAGAQTIQFYKLVTGSWVAVGTAVSYSSKSQVWFASGNFVSGLIFNWNFGQRPFAATAPGGGKALCTQNLPDPAIKKPSSYFNAKGYTGNHAANAVTGIGHQPDLLILKDRSVAYDACVFDSVRGGNYRLATSTTAAESNSTANWNLSSLDADGFTLAASSGSPDAINASGSSLIAWSWKEGVLPGLDIVPFTGTGATQLVNHNLGVAPSAIFVKDKVAANAWIVGHAFLNGGVTPWNYYTVLNTSAANAGSSSPWNNTAPSSTQFTIGNNAVNGNAQIAYVFAEVKGFSKFGMYIGNSSADGPFVHCGFRPRWIMIKRTDTASANADWIIYDSVRKAFNVNDTLLFADVAATETVTSTHQIDMLSNGFKIRSTGDGINASGGTYIFMAFAETPFKYARAK